MFGPVGTMLGKAGNFFVDPLRDDKYWERDPSISVASVDAIRRVWEQWGKLDQSVLEDPHLYLLYENEDPVRFVKQNPATVGETAGNLFAVGQSLLQRGEKERDRLLKLKGSLYILESLGLLGISPEWESLSVSLFSSLSGRMQELVTAADWATYTERSAWAKLETATFEEVLSELLDIEMEGFSKKGDIKDAIRALYIEKAEYDEIKREATEFLYKLKTEVGNENELTAAMLIEKYLAERGVDTNLVDIPSVVASFAKGKENLTDEEKIHLLSLFVAANRQAEEAYRNPTRGAGILANFAFADREIDVEGQKYRYERGADRMLLSALSKIDLFSDRTREKLFALLETEGIDTENWEQVWRENRAEIEKKILRSEHKEEILGYILHGIQESGAEISGLYIVRNQAELAAAMQEIRKGGQYFSSRIVMSEELFVSLYTAEKVFPGGEKKNIVSTVLSFYSLLGIQGEQLRNIEKKLDAMDDTDLLALFSQLSVRFLQQMSGRRNPISAKDLQWAIQRGGAGVVDILGQQLARQNKELSGGTNPNWRREVVFSFLKTAMKGLGAIGLSAAAAAYIVLQFRNNAAAAGMAASVAAMVVAAIAAVYAAKLAWNLLVAAGNAIDKRNVLKRLQNIDTETKEKLLKFLDEKLEGSDVFEKKLYRDLEEIEQNAEGLFSSVSDFPTAEEKERFAKENTELVRLLADVEGMSDEQLQEAIPAIQTKLQTIFSSALQQIEDSATGKEEKVQRAMSVFLFYSDRLAFLSEGEKQKIQKAFAKLFENPTPEKLNQVSTSVSKILLRSLFKKRLLPLRQFKQIEKQIQKFVEKNMSLLAENDKIQSLLSRNAKQIVRNWLEEGKIEKDNAKDVYQNVLSVLKNLMKIETTDKGKILPWGNVENPDIFTYLYIVDLIKNVDPAIIDDHQAVLQAILDSIAADITEGKIWAAEIGESLLEWAKARGLELDNTEYRNAIQSNPFLRKATKKTIQMRIENIKNVVETAKEIMEEGRKMANFVISSDLSSNPGYYEMIAEELQKTGLIELIKKNEMKTTKDFVEAMQNAISDIDKQIADLGDAELEAYWKQTKEEIQKGIIEIQNADNNRRAVLENVLYRLGWKADIETELEIPDIEADVEKEVSAAVEKAEKTERKEEVDIAELLFGKEEKKRLQQAAAEMKGYKKKDRSKGRKKGKGRDFLK